MKSNCAPVDAASSPELGAAARLRACPGIRGSFLPIAAAGLLAAACQSADAGSEPAARVADDMEGFLVGLPKAELSAARCQERLHRVGAAYAAANGMATHAAATEAVTDER